MLEYMEFAAFENLSLRLRILDIFFAMDMSIFSTLNTYYLVKPAMKI